MRLESHGTAENRKSMTLSSVCNAIIRGRPLIAGFGDSHVTTPVGGYGLANTPG